MPCDDRATAPTPAPLPDVDAARTRMLAKWGDDYRHHFVGLSWATIEVLAGCLKELVDRGAISDPRREREARRVLEWTAQRWEEEGR